MVLHTKKITLAHEWAIKTGELEPSSHFQYVLFLLSPLPLSKLPLSPVFVTKDRNRPRIMERSKKQNRDTLAKGQPTMTRVHVTSACVITMPGFDCILHL